MIDEKTYRRQRQQQPAAAVERHHHQKRKPFIQLRFSSAVAAETSWPRVTPSPINKPAGLFFLLPRHQRDAIQCTKSIQFSFSFKRAALTGRPRFFRLDRFATKVRYTATQSNDVRHTRLDVRITIRAVRSRDLQTLFNDPFEMSTFLLTKEFWPNYQSRKWALKQLFYFSLGPPDGQGR